MSVEDLLGPAGAVVGGMIGGPAGAAVGGSLGGAVGQSMKGDKAADQMSEASAASNATTRYMYDTTRADNLPFLQAGYQANDLIKALMSSGALTNTPTMADYKQDPSYQWQQNEAIRMGQNTAAARNGLYRGSTAKALQDRSQNMANADFGNWWSRQQQGTGNKINWLNAVRSGGQTASGQIGDAGRSYASTVSGNQSSLGNALAANSIAQGNLFGDAGSRISSYFTNSGGGNVGDASNMLTNKGYFSNLANGMSNNDVYWN